MRDADIISAIEWTTSVAPDARGGPRWAISGNLKPLKPGDKPVGASRNFRMTGARKVYFAVKMARIQQEIIERYRHYNEGPGDPPDTRAADLMAAAEVRD
jgi:hypothetical protein